MRLTLQTHGNDPEFLDRNAGTKMGDVVSEQPGRTIILTRNGAVIQGVGPNTILEQGDTITVVANKNVGRKVA
jgi:K+/H+ antiporter YhaU regulatory subunit KhtT